MNPIRRIAVVVFCGLLWVARGYACVGPIIVVHGDYDSYKEYVAPNQTFALSAECTYGGPIVDWWWTSVPTCDWLSWSELSAWSSLSGSDSSTGEYYLYAYGKNSGGAVGSDYGVVWVLAMTADIGVPEEQEENPGKFLAVGDHADLSLSYNPSNLWETGKQQELLATNNWRLQVKVYQSGNLIIDGTDTSETWTITGRDRPRIVTVEACMPGVVYLQHFFKVGTGHAGASDTVRVTVVQVDLDIWNEHDGPQLDATAKVSPGSFVLVNKDDDDGANGDDNSNNVIDGFYDRKDMAKMRLNVDPAWAPGLTIQLKASDASKVRVFNESDAAVTFPETIADTRFDAGALDYLVEGVSPGSCEFTLEVKSGSTLIWDPPPKVKVTVVDYCSAFNDWGAWPGGQVDVSLNPTETIDACDLDLSGNVKWAVDHGGTSATIVSHTPSYGTEWSQIVVRYDDQSADNSFTKAVEIKAYDTGSNSKLAAVRRTVFSSNWSPPNTSTGLNGSDLKRFDPSTGTNTDEAGFNWMGENQALWISAKMEGTLNLSPPGIDWLARGAFFAYGEDGGGAKWQYRLHRKRIGTLVGQLKGNPHRSISNDDENWVYDGDSDPTETQYPYTAEPDKAFRIDWPSIQNPTDLNQVAFRVDFRELAEWHNGSDWSTVTSTTNARWHANETSVLPDGRKGGLNNHGSGVPAANVPNTQPVADAGPDQNVASGAAVTLNGTGSSDADNDVLTYKWTQTGGPPVTLSSDTAESPTFTAPVGPVALTFQLKVSDICKSLYHHKPTNFESLADSVTITVLAP